MAKKKKTEPNSPDLTRNFETAFEKLEEIVSQLEQGQLTLAESLDRYEEGVRYLKQCYAALNQAERRIELMVNLDEDGRLITEPFETEGLDEELSQRSPRRRRGKTDGASSSRSDETGGGDASDHFAADEGLF